MGFGYYPVDLADRNTACDLVANGPLEVRYRAHEDGTVTAMARSDVAYWTVSNTDPELGLALGFGGLAVVGLSLAVNHARLSRLERRRSRLREHRRATRRAAMGRKKPDLGA